MRLSDYSKDRNNNFNLIRVLAAFAVLVFHSFPVATGSTNTWPFADGLGMTMGSVAVDVFFITSGFLVTSSLLYRQNTLEFLWARALRIFPALWVMLISTVFILGAYFTSLPTSDYFLSLETYSYLAKNAILIFGYAKNLPGVIYGNTPEKNTINISLWTMPYEVRMYFILAIFWLILRTTKDFRLPIFKFFVVASPIISLLYMAKLHFWNTHIFVDLFFMFFTGAAFYVCRKYIVLSGKIFLILLSILLISTLHGRVFVGMYHLVIAYLLFYLAYVPSGIIRKYNQLGDYSYGVYIYAFPVQRSFAVLIPGITVSQMVFISTIVTFS